MSDTSSYDTTLQFPEPAGGGQFRLQSFHQRHAAVISEWVRTNEQLKRLAPGTPGPLTPEKVIGWRRPEGHSFVLSRDGDAAPIGYAELNPMMREPRHYWLGHVIVCPGERGKGLGTAFVRCLAGYAFGRLDAGRISLIVLPDNAPALLCYKRVGFVQIRDEIHDFGTGRNSIRMLRLELRASDWS